MEPDPRTPSWDHSLNQKQLFNLSHPGDQELLNININEFKVNFCLKPKLTIDKFAFCGMGIWGEWYVLTCVSVRVRVHTCV